MTEKKKRGPGRPSQVISSLTGVQLYGIFALLRKRK